MCAQESGLQAKKAKLNAQKKVLIAELKHKAEENVRATAQLQKELEDERLTCRSLVAQNTKLKAQKKVLVSEMKAIRRRESLAKKVALASEVAERKGSPVTTAATEPSTSAEKVPGEKSVQQQSVPQQRTAPILQVRGWDS